MVLIRFLVVFFIVYAILYGCVALRMCYSQQNAVDSPGGYEIRITRIPKYIRAATQVQRAVWEKTDYAGVDPGWVLPGSITRVEPVGFPWGKSELAYGTILHVTNITKIQDALKLRPQDKPSETIPDHSDKEFKRLDAGLAVSVSDSTVGVGKMKKISVDLKDFSIVRDGKKYTTKLKLNLIPQSGQ